MCFGTSERGHLVRWWGSKCVNLWVVPPAIWDAFGISVFGLETRNLHPGGQREGVWRVEDSSAGGRQEGGRGVVRMGCPSLSPLRLSLSSLPLHVFSCSSCRSPYSLSGSDRQEFKGPLLHASSARTLAAGNGTRCSEGDWVRRSIQIRAICEFSSVSFMSDVHVRRDLCQAEK